MGRAIETCGIGLSALLAACAPTSAPRAAPPTRPPQEIPMTPAMAAVAEKVLLDAAQRSGRAQADLVVEGAEAVTWADGSLGCPEPGAMYTMALVPGYRIRIRAGTALLDYHASERGYFVLCPPGRAADPVGPVTE